MAQNKATSTAQADFHGFSTPNFTSVPDELFDVLMPQLSGAELKVLLYIIRRTFGFKKQQDEISLKQMVEGITTREGKVLDHGTGLHKESVAIAVRKLEKLEAITAHRRRSDKKGNEATTYSLKMRPLSENPTPPCRKIRQGLVEKSDRGLVGKSDPQQTVLQETDRQQNVVVTAQLEKLGITNGTAARIAVKHPEEYLLGKIDMVKWLVENQPRAVGKNPAGYLRKAIEEDWQPPAGYKSPEERAREEEEQRRAQEVLEAQRRAQEEERQRARERAAELVSRQYPAQPIEGSEHSTETAWNEALGTIQERKLVTKATYHTWLADTRLLWVEGDMAHVGVASKYAGEQLEHQYYQVLACALRDVLGREVEVEFVVMETKESPPKKRKSARKSRQKRPVYSNEGVAASP